LIAELLRQRRFEVALGLDVEIRGYADTENGHGLFSG
jgi:hypothetical protein